MVAKAKKDDKATIIETKMMKVADLHPYYKNPRIGDVGLIAESLEQNGQFRPIVVNIGTLTGRKFEILAGNHTWLGARHLAWKQLLVSLIDVDNVRARKIVLADNKTAEAGGFDPALLAELVQDLPDLSGTGYSTDEVQALLDNMPKFQADDGDFTPTSISDLLDGLNVGPGEEKDRRQIAIDDRDEDGKEAAHNRGASTATFDDDKEVEEVEPQDVMEQRKLAELQALLELREGENWFGQNQWQIPDLRSDMLVESVPENIRTWAGDEATPDDGKQFYLYNYSLGGTRGLPYERSLLSFYTHDDKFMNWWELPGYYTARYILRGITQAICPDFSFYFTQPRAIHLNGVYRSQWMGRFFQEAGIRVMPRVQFADDESLKFNMTGIPVGTPTLAVSLQNFSGADEEGGKSRAAREANFRKYLKLFQKCIDRLHPENQVIVYGGEPVLRMIDELKPGNAKVIGVLNYVGERREVVFGKKDGKAGMTGAQRKKILDAARKKAQESGESISYNAVPDFDEDGLDQLDDEIAELKAAEKAAVKPAATKKKKIIRKKVA